MHVDKILYRCQCCNCRNLVMQAPVLTGQVGVDLAI